MRSIIALPDKIRCSGEIFLLESRKAHCPTVARFDAAIFEVDVRVDGSRGRRGTAHVVQGVAVSAVPVGDGIFLPGEGIDSYDMDEDGVANISKLLPSHARNVVSDLLAGARH